MRFILASVVLLAWQSGPAFPPKPLPPVQPTVAAAPIDFASLHAQAKEAMERLQRAQDAENRQLRFASNITR